MDKRVLALLALVLALTMLLPALASEEKGRKDVLYACACGAECGCGSLSLKPGNCVCGSPLKWRHALRVEGDTALLCACEEGCRCKLFKDNPNKCGCGLPVQKASLKGKGIYFCNCGGSCNCNTFSDAPGECGCGMKLHKAE